MKKLAAMLAAVVALTSLSIPVTAENFKNVIVDGKTVAFKDVESQIVGNYVMLPVRFVSEAMGCTFTWKPEQKKAFVAADGFEAVFTVGSKEAEYIVNGEKTAVLMDAAAVLTNNRMLLPESALKSLAVMVGYNVLPEDADRSIIITSPDAVSVTVGGKAVEYEACAPALVGDTAMAPVRFVAGAMGLDFAWDAKTGVAKVTKDGLEAVFTVNNDSVRLGQTGVYKAERRIMLNGGRLYAPLKAIAETAAFFGAETQLEDNTLAITPAKPYKVSVGGEAVTFPDVQPLERDGVRLIPLRALCDKAGFKFLWFAADGYAKISNKDESKYVLLYAGADEYAEYTRNVESGRVRPDYPATLVGDRLLASIDTVIKLAGFFGRSAAASDIGLEIDPSDSGRADDNIVVEEEKNDVKVTYNGAEVVFPDAGCIIQEGRVLIPVRAVVEAMQMKVDWDGQGRAATIDNQGDKLKITVDSATMEGQKDGGSQSVELDVPAVIIDSRIYVPVRAVMEFFGATVNWEGSTRTVIINDDLSQGSEQTAPQPETQPDGLALLGFAVGAPEGAESVVSAAENGCARVEFTMGGIRYILLASGNGTDVSSRYGAEEGRALSYGVTVNGVDTKINAAALAAGGQLARWEIGAYKFSLYTAGEVSRSDMFSTASKAAQTFVITREVEENNKDEGPTAQLPNPVVPSGGDFSAIGMALSAPEGAESAEYSVIADKVAQSVFTYGGASYTFRGGVTGGDVSGVYSALEEGYDIIAAESDGAAVSVVARKIVGGGRLATWNAGGASFSLFTEANTSDEEFEGLCKLCAASGKSLKTGGGQD